MYKTYSKKPNLKLGLLRSNTLELTEVVVRICSSK